MRWHQIADGGIRECMMEQEGLRLDKTNLKHNQQDQNKKEKHGHNTIENRLLSPYLGGFVSDGDALDGQQSVVAGVSDHQPVRLYLLKA